MLYTLWDFETWYNDEDGYWVNNRFLVDSDIMINDDATNDEVIKTLVDIGYLAETALELVHLDWLDEFSCIIENQNTGEPLGQLIGQY